MGIFATIFGPTSHSETLPRCLCSTWWCWALQRCSRYRPRALGSDRSLWRTAVWKREMEDVIVQQADIQQKMSLYALNRKFCMNEERSLIGPTLIWRPLNIFGISLLTKAEEQKQKDGSQMGGRTDILRMWQKQLKGHFKTQNGDGSSNQTTGGGHVLKAAAAPSTLHYWWRELNSRTYPGLEGTSPVFIHTPPG